MSDPLRRLFRCLRNHLDLRLSRGVVAEASDIGERRRAREIDRLRREAEAISRLLRQARLDGIREDIEAAKARLDEAEARLESSNAKSE